MRHGRLTDQQIARKARNRYGLAVTYSNAVNGLMRQAKGSLAQGQLAQANPNDPTGGIMSSNIPVAPGFQGRYVYETLITIRDPRTGKTSVYSHRFYFTSMMSQNDIQQYVESNANQYVTPLSPVTFTPAQQSRASINVKIIGAGLGVL